MTIQLYNTLTRKKEPFTPIDANDVRMYVCGPTVYDRPHLGNARSVVVYDVLYRLLCATFPKVTYARNITDVDDKINAQAKANGEAISALTARVTQWFHDDMTALNCLTPTIEPRATAHIGQMIAIIEKLIKNGNAYESEGHVLFAVNSYEGYGQLSGRKLDDLIAGARVDVESYKKHAGDFVLWKPTDAEDDASSVFDSPWSKGRPGWHIECSAMSSEYLGENFDIHGGGADLMFPHHENEIAQSCCAAPKSSFANYWVHNGFLTVNGEKMSKSLGNFITVKDLLDKGVQGEVIRLAFLMTKYNEPLNWNDKLLSDSQAILDGAYRALLNASKCDVAEDDAGGLEDLRVVSDMLSNDLNTPALISIISRYTTIINSGLKDASSQAGAKRIARKFKEAIKVLGVLQQSPEAWFKGAGDDSGIQTQIDARIAAKQAKNWAKADQIRKALAEDGILLEDKPDGTTDWRRA